MHIIDATLREGTQAPGVRLSDDQALEIARALGGAGVDMIEVGHPLRSPAEAERIRRITALGVPVLAHARAHRADIDAVAESGAQYVGIFLGVNEVSRATRMPGRTTASLHARIAAAVQHAHCRGLEVRLTVEDASRTPTDELLAAFDAAHAAGADRLCFADTVGAAEPDKVRAAFQTLRRRFPSTPLEGHFHDDRGLAMANTLAALDGGANWISTSVNGLGERCGITDLAVLLANLELRGERRIRDGRELQRLSRLVAAHTRAGVDERRPVVGAHAFTHTARLHALAVERDEHAYSWIDPARLGRATKLAGAAQDATYVIRPQVIGASELPFHRDGPGARYVLLDERLRPDCREYLIVRRFPEDTASAGATEPGHVDAHRHTVDSWHVFLGTQDGFEGLSVEVTLDGKSRVVTSPATVFVPAGIPHSYRWLSGAGLFLNHLPVGRYEAGLLDPASHGKEG